MRFLSIILVTPKGHSINLSFLYRILNQQKYMENFDFIRQSRTHLHRFWWYGANYNWRCLIVKRTTRFQG